MNGNNHIKGIIIDLDNTLYDYAPCNEYGKNELFAFLAKELGIKHEEIADCYNKSRAIINKRLFGLGSSHSRILYIKECLDTLMGKTPYKLALESEKIFWDAYFTKAELKAGAIAFLEEAQKRNIKIASLSDLTTQIQFQKVLHLKLEKYIQYFISSEEAGREKPEKEGFKLTLEKMGLKNSEVIMIGDNYEKDIVGAQKQGIENYYLSENQEKPANNTTQIKNFKELTNILFPS